MFAAIPTYIVTIHADEDYKWRVPESSLEAFLHVLNFNKVQRYSVDREPPLIQSSVQQ